MSASQRILVLGGTGVVGQAVCRELAAAGASLALTYLSQEAEAVALARELGARAFPLDAGSSADVAATVDRAASELGGLDGLVHCAAVGITVEAPVPADRPHTIAQIDEAGWDRMLAVNTKSAFFAVQSLLPHLPAEGGNVVLIGSVDGIKPVPAPVHYAASKGALGAMARAMAKELGGRGVKVNVVAPGVLEAGISETLPRPLIEEYEKHCGFKRRGKPGEVAGLVAWLALSNTYVTGQTILLDGAL